MLSVTWAEGAEMKVNLVAVQATTELMADETDAEEIVAASVEVDGRG